MGRGREAAPRDAYLLAVPAGCRLSAEQLTKLTKLTARPWIGVWRRVGWRIGAVDPNPAAKWWLQDASRSCTCGHAINARRNDIQLHRVVHGCRLL
jgi:hypothetical protein